MTPADANAASSRWRIFIAAWPDDACLDALEPIDRWLNRFRTHRLIPREQRHLTLAFLGDVELTVVEALDLALCEKLITFEPVSTVLDGVIGIPSAHKARIVAAALARDPALLTFMEQVLCVAAEIAPVDTVLRDLDRDRKPHITLARTRRSEKARRVDLSAAPSLQAVFQIQSIAIVRSHLTPQGPQYEVVRAIPVGAR